MESVYIPGSRIFLGNLASDHTSEREIRDMFLRYGNVKEVVIRKGFGFVQFDSSEAAQRAIEAENGRTFRGYKLDVSLATGESRKSTDKPRDVPRSELPRPDPRPLPRPDPRPLPRPEPRREHRPRSRDIESRGRDVDRSRDSRERRDRKRSRSREWREERASKRVHLERGAFESRAVQCRVLYNTPLLSSLAQDLCAEIERVVRATGSHVSTDCTHVLSRELDAELRYLDSLLGDAAWDHERRAVPYVCVLRETYSANIRDFRLRRKSEYFLDLFVFEAATGRYREQRDTEYEVACDTIAACESDLRAATSANTSAALLALLAPLAQQPRTLTPQPVPQSRTDLTALLAQLAPLLPGTAAPALTPALTSIPAPPLPAAPSAEMHDLNSLVRQLIQSELHALAAPSQSARPGTPSAHDLLHSLLGTPNSHTARALPLPTTTATNNTSSQLLSALQTLLQQTQPL